MYAIRQYSLLFQELIAAHQIHNNIVEHHVNIHPRSVLFFTCAVGMHNR